MATKSWVIWIIVIVAVIGAGFGGWWWYSHSRVGADEPTSTTSNTQLTVKQGWNFIAFPYNVPSTIANLEIKFGTTIKLEAMYRWSGSTWIDAMGEASVKPGTGYLAYFSQGGTVDLGNTQEVDYKKVEVPLAANEWQLVGKPLLGTVQFRSSSSSSTSYLPYTGLAVKLTDGTTVSTLDAIAKGYIKTPLFLENSNPSYSYVKLYDLSGNSFPDFNGAWVKPLSANVESLVFDTQGQAGSASISRETLETADSGGTVAPSTP